MPHLGPKQGYPEEKWEECPKQVGQPRHRKALRRESLALERHVSVAGVHRARGGKRSHGKGPSLLA